MVNGRTDAEDMARAAFELSLRDKFAAAALTGVLANEGEGASLSGTCQWAYRIADAMLRERAAAAEPRDQSPACVAAAWATAQQVSDAADFVRFREEFEAWKNGRHAAEPLALTADEHRAACEATAGYIAWQDDNANLAKTYVKATIATLRGLIERTGGSR